MGKSCSVSAKIPKPASGKPSRRRRELPAADLAAASRSAALIARVACAGILVVVALGVLNPYAAPTPPPLAVLLFAVPVIILIRSFQLGIRVGDDQVVVVSWFTTYRIPRSTIVKILRQPYSGLLTGGVGGNNMFSSRMQVLGFRTSDGRARIIAGTLAPNRKLRATALTLSKLLGVPIESVAG